MNEMILQLTRRFGEQETFTRDELFGFYTGVEPALNTNTFAWRIHDLKSKRLSAVYHDPLFR